MEGAELNPPSCPECGGSMELRRARRGRDATSAELAQIRSRVERIDKRAQTIFVNTRRRGQKHLEYPRK